MANTLPAELEPRIIADALKILVAQLPMLKFMNKDYSGASAEIGESVTVPVVASGTVKNAVYSMTPPTPTDATVNNGVITIDNHKSIDFGLTSKEIQKYLLDGTIPRMLQQRVADMAESIAGFVWDQIDAAAVATTIPSIKNWTADVDGLGDVRTQLQIQKVSTAMRMGFLNNTQANALMKIDQLQKWNERGGGITLEEGELGKLMTMRMFEDNAIDSTTRNIFGDFAGFGMVMRLPADDVYDGQTLGVKTAVSDPNTGIPLRLVRTPGFNMASWTLDVMYGGNVQNGQFFHGATTAADWV